MKCSMCGVVFDENLADKACAGCVLHKGCKLLRCPNCGYEMPPEPKWLKEMLANVSKLFKKYIRRIVNK